MTTLRAALSKAMPSRTISFAAGAIGLIIAARLDLVERHLGRAHFKLKLVRYTALIHRVREVASDRPVTKASYRPLPSRSLHRCALIAVVGLDKRSQVACHPFTRRQRAGKEGLAGQQLVGANIALRGFNP